MSNCIRLIRRGFAGKWEYRNFTLYGRKLKKSTLFINFLISLRNIREYNVQF